MGDSLLIRGDFKGIFRLGYYATRMEISQRLVNAAARQTQQTPDALLLREVQHSAHLSVESEEDFAALLDDRSVVVNYEVTDPLRAAFGLHPRHNAALGQLYSHSPTSRGEGFTLAREIEGKLGDRNGVFSVYDEGDGMVELSYRNGDKFTKVFVDTTPGLPGEQYIIADSTALLRKAFGGG